MRSSISKIILIIFIFSFLVFSISYVRERFKAGKDELPLTSLLPEVESWKFSEPPQTYFPETLYEYIDGAAEIYLSYDFKELIVGQYKKISSLASFSIEIYSMGNEENAFGIYSAERFPEARFIAVGNQGYIEEGTLNLIVGKYYIKLLCFDCGDEAERILKFFSQSIIKNVKEKGKLPLLLQLFPKEGLVLNSEKFVLNNFMGYKFLHNGYLASYKQGDLKFDCFLIEAKSLEEAKNMISSYLAAENKEDIKRISPGYHLKDRYYQHIYLTRVKNYLCGVMKIKDGYEEVGERYLKALVGSLNKFDHH